MQNHFSDNNANDRVYAPPDQVSLAAKQNHLESETLFNRMTKELGELRTSQAPQPAPDSELARFGYLTIKSIEYTPQGLVHAVNDTLSNPDRTGWTIIASAIVSTFLKLALPETCPSAKIAMLALGAYFGCEAAQKVSQSFKAVASDTTIQEIDLESRRLGDAAGTFVFDSALAAAISGIGAYRTERMLLEPQLQNFNASRREFWNKIMGPEK